MTQNAHAFATLGAPDTNTKGGLFASFSATLAARRARNSARANIRRELESYTDRQLNDLGLSRIDIDDVASGRYRR